MNATAVQTLPACAEAPEKGRSLKDLLEDGFYLVFMLRKGQMPPEAKQFAAKVDAFLKQFEQSALAEGKGAAAVHAAKYAFCALMDEVVLSSKGSIRDEWESAPLQLTLFGEHLAGEGFFKRLEELRGDAAAHLEVLEVYHLCLLLGFQGKYLLEGEEKLNYLIGRLSQELAQLKGTKPEFAPSWKPVHRIQRFIRHEFPLWGFYALLGVMAILVFLTLHFLLRSQVRAL